MKGVGSLILIVVFLTIVISSCNGSSKSSNNSSDNVAATQSKPAPTWDDVLNAHPARSQVLCNSYDTLVNQGWSDDDIYQNLSDAGTFDQFYGQGRDFFNAMVKWCYANNY